MKVQVVKLGLKTTGQVGKVVGNTEHGRIPVMFSGDSFLYEFSPKSLVEVKEVKREKWVVEIGTSRPSPEVVSRHFYEHTAKKAAEKVAKKYSGQWCKYRQVSGASVVFNKTAKTLAHLEEV